MLSKIIIISLICCFLGGCVDNAPPKKSVKAKHKEKELLPAEISLQKAGLIKDTLYFLYKKVRLPNGSIDNKPIYVSAEQGIIFNLTDDGKSYESFLFEDGSIFDTLDIEALNKYKITPIGKVDSIHKSWHEKNKKIVKEVMGHWLRQPPIINENFAYVVYVIKIADDKKTFTIYPVVWRNFDYDFISF